MKMLPNGNWEEVICPIQHQCKSEDYIMTCTHYSWKEGLILSIDDGDPYEDGYANEFMVKHCPFCGYRCED